MAFFFPMPGFYMRLSKHVVISLRPPMLPESKPLGILARDLSSPGPPIPLTVPSNPLSLLVPP